MASVGDWVRNNKGDLTTSRGHLWHAIAHRWPSMWRGGALIVQVAKQADGVLVTYEVIYTRADGKTVSFGIVRDQMFLVDVNLQEGLTGLLEEAVATIMLLGEPE